MFNLFGIKADTLYSSFPQGEYDISPPYYI